MAHFAHVVDGIVRQVIVVDNEAIGGGSFPDDEAAGQAFIESLGFPGTWLQASYTAAFRGAFPGVGWTYDDALDVFTAPPTTPAPDPEV